MNIVLSLITIAALGTIIFNAGRWLFPSKRAAAKRWLIGSSITFIASFTAIVFVATKEQNEIARSKGFSDGSEMSTANKLGFTDAKAYSEFRESEAKIEKEKSDQKISEARQAAEQLLLEQKADDAKRAQRAAEAAETKRRADEAENARAAAAEELCFSNLSCAGEKQKINANVYCPSLVERSAKYQAEWTDGWTEMKFPLYKWKNQNKGIITYIGDKVKFQNASELGNT